MSAYGYKQTYGGQLANVRFTPESRHRRLLTFTLRQAGRLTLWQRVLRKVGETRTGLTLPNATESPAK